jgi:hypothetical protein
MPSAVSSVTQPVTTPAATTTQKTAKPKPQPAKTDSVQLSSAAQARLAALQEFTETPAQTSKEAGSGDRQAQRLQAKEQAAKPANK